MSQKNILVIPGDGIGREVTQWGKAALDEIAKIYGYNFSFSEASMGHESILANGTAMPDYTLEKAKESDAILFGAVGHKIYDEDPSSPVRPEQGLFKLRKELGLYTNIRPIVSIEELVNSSSLKPEVIRGTDILFYRELTGGAYFGDKNWALDGNVASDLMIYHRYEIERIAEKAFTAAGERRKKICSVDKANALVSSRLWRKVIKEVAQKYPDIEVTHLLVDNAAMQLVRNPKQFDVVVTGNLFGDILTDEASQIVGSMGLLASASLGDKNGLFEPVHGSAYDIAGQDKANPIASILSAAMMLEMGFDMKEEGGRIRESVSRVLKEGYRTMDIAESSQEERKIVGTKRMGRLIVDGIK